VICCCIVIGSSLTKIELEEIMRLDVVCKMTLARILNIQANEDMFFPPKKSSSAQNRN
jgi:hypothetical protein